MVRIVIGWALVVGCAATLSAQSSLVTTSVPAIVIDGQSNLLMRLRRNPALTVDNVELQGFPAGQLDLPRLRQGGVAAEFFATFVSADSVRRGTAVKETLEQLDQLRRLAQRFPDDLEIATSTDHLGQIHRDGKVAMLLEVSGGDAIDGSLSVLRTYHRSGVRCMALTHDVTTAWADAALDQPKHRGLSSFGEQVVAEMNRLGLAIDLSHAAPDTVRDTLALSRAPVLFTHSAASALAPYPRNLSDDLLKAVAKNGGVVMVNFYPGFLTAAGVKAYEARTQAASQLRKAFRTETQFQEALTAWLKEHPLPATDVKHVVDQIEHIGRVAGFDHVGLGSNFDGGVSVSRGLEDVSCFPRIAEELTRRGHGPEVVGKVMGQNALRALRAVEAAAE